MWELDHKEDSAKELMLSNCGAEEDSWKSIGQQGIKPVHPKGNQLWIFIGRTDAEAKAPVLGHLMQRANVPEKTLMLGRIEAKGEEGSKELDH